MLVSHGDMILVIDGAKMSLFRNRGKDFATDLELVEDGAQHAATEKLNSLAQQSNFEFIVVAPPRILGEMRHHYSPDLRKRLIAEIDKDYAGRPVADIAELLRHHEP